MKRRASHRGVTALEAAVAFAVVGSLLVISALSFRKHWRSSRLVEAVSGLDRIGRGVTAARENGRSIGSAPLTPADVPRAPIIDPEGTWVHPTWQALDFRASPEGVPHSFSFALDVNESAFDARAHGDLDGDGVRSTFELRGKRGEDGRLVTVPGLRVEHELE